MNLNKKKFTDKFPRQAFYLHQNRGFLHERSTLNLEYS